MVSGKECQLPMDSDKAWSTYHVIEKLVESADILLHKKDYDGHGWEEIEICYQRGKEILQQIKLGANEEMIDDESQSYYGFITKIMKYKKEILNVGGLGQNELLGFLDDEDEQPPINNDDNAVEVELPSPSATSSQPLQSQNTQSIDKRGRSEAMNNTLSDIF